MRRQLLVYWTLVTGLCAGQAVASDTVALFAKVSPSVVVLQLADDKGGSLGVLSAVAFAPGRLVSTCSALGAAHALTISSARGNVPVTLASRDSRRDLCVLEATSAALVPLPRRDDAESAPPGTRVYAVSNALGLGIGLSEGVLSGVRSFSSRQYLQFSAPISPGSDGGALVDEQGRLLGVIQYRHRDGQNVNFAIPIRWVDAVQGNAAEDSFEQLTQRAGELERAQQWEALAALAKQWSLQYPQDNDAWQWMAVAASQRKDLVSEELAWREIFRRDGGSHQAGLRLASVLLRQGKAKEALELARGLLAQRREDAELWVLIGAAELVQGSLDQAEQAFTQAIAIHSGFVPAYRGLITIAQQRGNAPAVTAHLQRLARLVPESAEVRAGLVNAYIDGGQAAKAYALLAQLDGEAVQSADTWFLRGRTLAALRRPLEAIGAYQRSLADRATPRPWVHAYLGVLYRELQRFPESVAALREAVRLDPGNLQWRYELGWSLKDSGYATETIEIDQQLIKQGPQNPYFWRQLGLAYGMLARHEESIKALEQALQYDSRQGKVWAALAEQYHALGRSADVSKVYAQLQGIDASWAAELYRSHILPFEEAR